MDTLQHIYALCADQECEEPREAGIQLAKQVMAIEELD